MSVRRVPNPLAIAGYLGPSTPTLDHLVRFLNSVSGTDKVLMFIQYFTKILVWHLQRTSPPRRLIDPKSPPATSLVTHLQNLAGPVSDFRILLRYYGLIPMIKFMAYLEHHQPASPLLLHLERVQNICNIIYYPLEHAYWLGAHNVIPLSERTTNKIAVWSCRFWAAYVALQFVHLAEEWRLANLKEQDIAQKAMDIDDKEQRRTEVLAVATMRKDIILNTITNAAYLPLTVHWSLENSTFPDIGVGICGTIAAICQLYATWQSTSM
ncbi:peroxisomal biogenesis factor 11 [Endogone sp. FLAS-F59071]|nr:peroxisomal biogenesis factor 11 [Endogone sp. FLAS-F59071]|eukprot:RUS15609.1 peroxisomal biogenesis factor 11 [Endogone sp. FLAS-F59071]